MTEAPFPERSYMPLLAPEQRLNAPLPSPIDAENRIEAIDVLRGFALLGILLINIQSYAMPGVAYVNPHAYGDLNGANYSVWWFTHVFGDQKFMSIFSMLFGAGIILMTSRAEKRTGRSAAIHYRRMGWLVLFGLLHAHLIWYGDILYSYGMCGMLVWLVRKWRPSILITIGLILLPVASLLMLAVGASMPWWGEQAISEFNQGWNPSVEVIQDELNTYLGSWLDQMPSRMLVAATFQTFMFAVWSFWRVTGLMCIGMAMFKLGVFQARRSWTFYACMMIVGMGIGLPLSAYGVEWNNQRNWAIESSFFFGPQFNYWGSLFTSFGYIGAMMLVCKSAFMLQLLKPLAAVGRMALTNYLLHSIICTMIFYGHGFGYFGSVERTGQLAIVVCIWVGQLMLSPIWLRYFEFGPFEWLWRSLTYWRIQPFIKREPDRAVAAA